jgi:hypothetical protein
LSFPSQLTYPCLPLKPSLNRQDLRIRGDPFLHV